MDYLLAVYENNLRILQLGKSCLKKKKETILHEMHFKVSSFHVCDWYSCDRVSTSL